MSDSKVPIPMIVLVAVAVGLYITATVMGRGPDGGLQGCAPSTERKQDLRSGCSWFTPARVERSDTQLQGCVRNGDRIRFQKGADCTISIEAIESRTGSRAFKIMPEAAFDVVLRPKGDDAIDIEAKAKIGKRLELTIPKEGATIKLTNCGEGANGCLAGVE